MDVMEHIEEGGIFIDHEYEIERDYENENEHEHYEDDERGANERASHACYDMHCTWAPLEVGKVELLVSSTGAVRLKDSAFWNVHYGIVVPGTPYRSVTLRHVYDDEPRAYYIHELVWRAFEGDIANGWFVGHKMDEWRHLGSAGEVSNALHALELYEKRVTTSACDS
jgi:hypothetical protein